MQTSKLRTVYTRNEAETFLNISGNMFCGQVGGEAARWVSERFPKIQRQRSGVTTYSTDTSENISLQWEPTVTPATIAGLSSGEFVGMLSDEPGRELELKAFHGRLIREEGGKRDAAAANGKAGSQAAATLAVQTPVLLPVVRAVDETTVRQQFEQVRREVQGLVAEALKTLPV